MKIVTLLALTLLACQSEAPRRSARADSGGKQVDSTGGVRLKLAVASAPYRAGELPPMEAYIENVGSGFVTFVGEAVEAGEVEIDGVWHNVIYAGSCCSAPETLPPHATSRSLPIRISLRAIGGFHGPVDIPPGRHKIRLRTRPSEHIWINGNGRSGIIVVSNAVDINVR